MQLLLVSTLFAFLRPHPVFAAPSGVKTFTLDIANKDLAPDGQMRSTVVANGQYPGPAITAVKGQTLRVTVNNKLTDPTMRRSTTVSFDGVFQTTQNAYNEGSAFVTTCPIAPNASYIYEVSLGDQTGTFWYHSELSVQYVDGLRGPLIVYDPQDPLAHLYDVDDLSTIIQLGDWWQTSSETLLAAYQGDGVVPISDSGTVNGIGRFQGGPEVPFAVTQVVSGKRYRLRIINESARNVFTVSIDNHPLTIIEADGVATVPHTVDLIEMLAGQRYSVVITADQPVANYWLNAPFTGGSPARNLHQNATLSRSILRYKGAPIAEPTTPWTAGPANGTSLVEADLRPLDAIPACPTFSSAPTPDVNITLDLTVVPNAAIWNVNNVSYLPPKVPTLNQILAGADTQVDFNVTENTFVLPANKTVQISFPPTDDDDAHPLHLHGNNFWVIKSMSSTDINTVNPIRRDVVGVGGSGTTIRFRTDNAGPWFFHCHIFWHKAAGLATVMVADPEAIQKETKPSKAWNALCPA
ncbi:hypothetical protein H2248_008411 [Termitomyces sp. 'cryptogamus']|nr:hypothetical protein H2248_008411 [Termitomyces sp. 'cryptogamus']